MVGQLGNLAAEGWDVCMTALVHLQDNCAQLSYHFLKREYDPRQGGAAVYCHCALLQCAVSVNPGKTN